MSIECLQLSKAYKSKVLFTELNITFKKGLCNCIVGENGSGKTTLLRVLTGLEKADAGQVRINGTCTYSGSNPYMLRGTVAENIFYPLTLKQRKQRADKRSVQDIIDQLGLQGLENRQAQTLSSGEKQKVALGRALVWNPDILLLDEPTANIDVETIQNIEKILLEYVKNQTHTLILVSHDFEQVKRMSGETYVFKDQNLAKFPYEALKV